MPTTFAASTFGDLLKHLRRRAHMTQGELAALVGFSISQISLLEKNERLPDLALVRDKFATALALHNEPRLLQRLLELAAQARGESFPLHLQVERTVETILHEEIVESSGSLPAVLTSLLGRQHEVKSAAQRLMDAPGRMLTLVGPPGVGKSRLALAIGEQLHPLFADGAHFVELSAISDPADLANALLAALALSESSGKPAQQRVIEALRRSERLLILDNFEQLLLPADEQKSATRCLLSLLSECPHVRLLVTSREPLRLRLEQRFKVQPLEVAAAIELFLQRAESVDPDFSPSATSLTAITEICQRLDCLPLAIELIAARIDLLSPQAMLTRLKDRSLDLLSDGPSDLPPHQRTLRAAIQRSYALLSTSEQQLFRHAGVFAGSFDLAAVESLNQSWATISGLQSLIAKSLVKPLADTNGERRYQLLETLRDYAIEQLVANGEEATARQQHASHFGEVAEQADQQSFNLGSPQPLTRLEADHENMRAALRWLLVYDPQAAQRLVGALRRFWYMHGYLEEGQRWAESALAAADTATVQRAAALLALGQMLLNQGKNERARNYLSQALAIFEQKGDWMQLANSHIELGWAVYLAHKPNESLAHFRKALTLAEEIGLRSVQAHALTSLAHVMVYEGSYTAELKGYIEESIALCQALGDTENVVHALLNLSTFYIHTSEYAAALDTLHEIERNGAIHFNRTTRGWVKATQAELYLITGELERVQPLLEQADPLFRSSNNHDGLTLLYLHWGELARKNERWQDANSAFETSERLARLSNNERVIARCLMGKGRVAQATGENQLARAWMQQAQTILNTMPAFLPPAIAEEYAAAWNLAGQ